MSIYYIDFSGARPGAAAIKQAGASGVLRYLSAPVANTAWKRSTKAEIASYIAAGLDVILNYEYYQGRMLEGATAGKIDGGYALAQAKSIGYPNGATIYFSHDTSARNDAAVLAYMKAATSALKGYYLADIYSGIDVVELVKRQGWAKYGWQTVAWSRRQVGTCHLYQNGNQWFNHGADENVVRTKPLGSWKDALAPKPAPKPIPTDSKEIAVATVAEVVKGIWNAKITNPKTKKTGSAAARLLDIETDVHDIKAKVDKIVEKLGA